MKAWQMVAALVGGTLTVAGARAGEPTLTSRIDHGLEAVWNTKGVLPAGPATDAEFLRRVSLDLTGTIPTAAEVRAFLADGSPDRHRKVIQRLLDGPGYVRHMTNLWRDELMPATNGPQVAPWRAELEAWLRQRFRDGVTYDRFAREVLTVSLNFNPATRGAPPGPLPFYRANDLKPENVSAAVSRTFLGVHLDCARCHDHPFEPWTQRQFAEFTAFFAGARATRMQGGRVAAGVEDPSIRSFALPDKDPVEARFLDGSIPDWKGGGTPREALADWIVSRNNPYFARHAVNRIWAQMFGDSLSEGEDTFADLLKELTADFTAHGFDSRRLLQALAESRAYRATSTGDAPVKLFARMRTRGLGAEQMHDSLARATGLVEGEFASLRTDFLARFQQLGERPADRQPSMLQVLALMNGKLIDEVARGRMVKAIAEAPWLDARGRVEELFLATLSRLPTSAEVARLTPHIERHGRAGLSDLMWALLNSSEFILNP